MYRVAPHLCFLLYNLQGEHMGDTLRNLLNVYETQLPGKTTELYWLLWCVKDVAGFMLAV